jgi:hypothetical protein
VAHGGAAAVKVAHRAQQLQQKGQAAERTEWLQVVRGAQQLVAASVRSAVSGQRPAVSGQRSAVSGQRLTLSVRGWRREME